MATHLSLLCCAGTASARTGGFPGPDEPLDEGGLAKAKRHMVGRASAPAVTSPARAATGTAAAIGIEASVEPRLADMDFGVWAGLSFSVLHERDPTALADWLADPRQAAPGGESFEAVRARIRPWLAEVAGQGGPLLAISHAMPIRAVLAEALGLPDEAAMRVDIAPLSVAILSFHRGWRLQQLRAD